MVTNAYKNSLKRRAYNYQKNFGMMLIEHVARS